jgi:hypothetical protein
MGLLPLLVMFAIPEDPDLALGQLDHFGPMPECRMEERIETTALDHVHRFSPPKVLSSLEGKGDELLPWLSHPNRRVMLRAVELLCHTGSAAVPPRLRALATDYPCERPLLNAAVVLTHDEKLAELGSKCPWDPPAVRLTPARTLGHWPADAAAAKAISSGDTAVLKQTLWNLDALLPVRAQGAVATLALVDSPRGILATARAVFGHDASGQVDALLRGFFGAQLDALAARLQSNQLAAWCAVVSVASVEDYALLQSIENRLASGDRALLEKEAEKARLKSDLPPFGRAYLEKLARPQHDWMEGRNRLRAFVDHRDRPALRAFLKDDTNALSDRLEAAKELALLGDATGLVLWQTADGLWPEERAERRALLAHLSHEAPPDVRAQAEALLKKTWPP